MKNPSAPDMPYRQLGHSGLWISAISIGSWLTYGNSVDNRTAFTCLDAALEAGVNFVDTADVYNRGEAELAIGEWLQGKNREHIILGTKVFFPMSEHWMDRGLSARHIQNSVQASLERLGTEYVDLYQCHRYDYSTPLEETCYAMHSLIEGGYILHWGVSQWTSVQIVNALRICEQNGWRKPISDQPIYNMLNRSLEVEVMEVCETEGLGLVVFSPLAQGILSGKYSPDNIPADSRAGRAESKDWFSWKRLNPETFALLDRLRPIAKKLDVSLSQLALAWCLRRKPITSCITGASKPEQVRENVAAVKVALSEEIQNEIEQALGNHPRDQYTDQLIGYGVPKTT